MPVQIFARSLHDLWHNHIDQSTGTEYHYPAPPLQSFPEMTCLTQHGSCMRCKHKELLPSHWHRAQWQTLRRKETGLLNSGNWTQTGRAGPTISSLLYWLAMQCPMGRTVQEVVLFWLTVRRTCSQCNLCCKNGGRHPSCSCRQRPRNEITAAASVKKCRIEMKKQWSLRLDTKGANWKKPEKTRRKSHRSWKQLTQINMQNEWTTFCCCWI